MTPADTAKVLAKLAAFDQRTIGETDVRAWHEVIGHMEVQDCLAAVTEHYRESANRAMPADIRRIAISIRDARHSRERVAERREAIESGPTVRDRSAEVTALVESVAASLPQPTNHDRALARARRDRGRPYAPPTKERRKPKAPKDYPPPASDDVATLATRYLLDGHEPRDVAKKLAVSRRWCERTAKQLRSPREDAA